MGTQDEDKIDGVNNTDLLLQLCPRNRMRHRRPWAHDPLPRPPQSYIASATTWPLDISDGHVVSLYIEGEEEGKDEEDAAGKEA